MLTDLLDRKPCITWFEDKLSWHSLYYIQESWGLLVTLYICSVDSCGTNG